MEYGEGLVPGERGMRDGEKGGRERGSLIRLTLDVILEQ